MSLPFISVRGGISSDLLRFCSSTNSKIFSCFIKNSSKSILLRSLVYFSWGQVENDSHIFATLSLRNLDVIFFFHSFLSMYTSLNKLRTMSGFLVRLVNSPKAAGGIERKLPLPPCLLSII